MGSICEEVGREGLAEDDIALLHTEPIRGLNQPLRYALFLSLLPFKQVVHSDLTAFRKHSKYEMPLLSTLPALQRGSFSLCYVQPCMSFVLKITNRTDLLGKSVTEAAEIADMQALVCTLMNELHELNYDRMIHVKLRNFAARRLPDFERLLETTANITFLGGRKSLSSADLYFYQLTFWVAGICSKQVNRQSARLSEQYRRTVQERSSLRDYLRGSKGGGLPFFGERGFWVGPGSAPCLK